MAAAFAARSPRAAAVVRDRPESRLGLPCRHPECHEDGRVVAVRLWRCARPHLKSGSRRRAQARYGGEGAARPWTLLAPRAFARRSAFDVASLRRFFFFFSGCGASVRARFVGGCSSSAVLSIFEALISRSASCARRYLDRGEGWSLALLLESQRWAARAYRPVDVGGVCESLVYTSNESV